MPYIRTNNFRKNEFLDRNKNNDYVITCVGATYEEEMNENKR